MVPHSSHPQYGDHHRQPSSVGATLTLACEMAAVCLSRLALEPRRLKPVVCWDWRHGWS